MDKQKSTPSPAHVAWWVTLVDDDGAPLRRRGRLLPQHRLIFARRGDWFISDALVAVRYSTAGAVFPRSVAVEVEQAPTDSEELTVSAGNIMHFGVRPMKDAAGAAIFRGRKPTIVGWARRPRLGFIDGIRPSAAKRNWDPDMVVYQTRISPGVPRPTGVLVRPLAEQVQASA